MCKSVEGEIKYLKNLELDFESKRIKSKEKFISVKAKLNLKMNDLQKGECNIISD